MKQILFIGLLWILSLAAVWGEDAKYYRAQIQDTLPPDQRGEALALATMREQIKNLRESLGTSTLGVAEFVDLAKISSVRPHSRFASSILKSYLTIAADKLWQTERRDVPIAFDPSDFSDEAQAKVTARRQAIFDELVAPKLEALVTDINVQVTLKNENAGLRNHTEDALKASLSAYLAKHGAEIASIIGELEWAEVQEGRVVRLHFGKTDPLNISLGMLVNYRTQHDDAYLVMLEFLVDAIQKKAESFYKKDKNGQLILDADGRPQRRRLNAVDTENLGRYENALRLLVPRYAGARKANEKLAKLSTQQINFLIDLLIQLRGDDWLVGYELMPASVLVGRESERLRKINEAAKKETVVDQATIDIVFYTDLYQQIFNLAEFLNVEREAEADQAKLMNEQRNQK